MQKFCDKSDKVVILGTVLSGATIVVTANLVVDLHSTRACFTPSLP